MKLSALFALLLLAAIPAQEPRAELDGVACQRIQLRLDPFGTLWLQAQCDAGELACDVRFPQFAYPVPGEYSLRDIAELVEPPVAVALTLPGEKPQQLNRGQVLVEECTPQRVRLEIRWPDGERERRLRFSGAPKLFRVQPPELTGARALPEFPPANDTPQREDLVFCVLGNGGSGLPGQMQIAQQVAALAPTGPLDFALLIGDVFLPKPPADTRDPLWQTRFEDVYDRRKLAVPFYVALGPNDYTASGPVLFEYGRTNLRWTLPAFGHAFTVESHGQKLQFFAIDTNGLLFDPVFPQHRVANRMFVHHAYQSDAQWKIAFGHHALYSSGAHHDDADQKKLREGIERWFERYNVDVYFSAHDRTLELLAPKRGITHVTSGGAGGPELAGSLQWREETLFGHTGGGFTWCRFDGEKLEISFRDAAGKVLFVHHVTKERR